MIAKLVASALRGGFGALLTAPSPSVINDEVAIKCSARCQVLQGNTINVTNPGGGTMTVTYVGLSPGICGCEVLPCVGLEACAGAIRFAFDDHVSWKTWVPQVEVNGVVTPVCAMPGAGSNDPPDHDEKLRGCGDTKSVVVKYWKKRSDATDQVDINPDLTASLSCPSCAAATNCQ
jgi:hypothetical protein